MHKARAQDTLNKGHITHTNTRDKHHMHHNNYVGVIDLEWSGSLMGFNQLMCAQPHTCKLLLRPNVCMGCCMYK